MDTSTSTSSSSFISKAKTVFHSAAAKAERVITEIKADLKPDHGQIRNSETKTSQLNETPKDLHPRESSRNFISMVMKNKSEENVNSNGVPKEMIEHESWRRYFVIDKQRKQKKPEKNNTENPCVSQKVFKDETFRNEEKDTFRVQIPEKDPLEEEAYAKAFTMVSIPSSSILRQLAMAMDGGKGFKTINDLVITDSTQSGDWSGLRPTLSAMRILSVGDKDEKFRTYLQIHEEDEAVLSSLFVADKAYCGKQYDTDPLSLSKAQFPEDIHGAPPGSFVSRLAEIMGSIKKMQRMADFWLKCVGKIRSSWDEGHPIPLLPVDSHPDLRYCLLYQQLQTINCCIARKKRRLTTLKLLTSEDTQVLPENKHKKDASLNQPCELTLNMLAPALYAKLKTGEIIQRHGVLNPAENMSMLETGEPVFSPITQEGPILTEDLLRETEELILRTGSDGAGCSQLFSDMQAFKAANPGCILEDFVRWHSPPDWTEDADVSSHCSKMNDDSEGSSSHGRLSRRMRSEGNLWQKLWESARPVPAAKQTPLFDEDLAGERALSYLEDIAPSDLFKQLFIAILSSGFAIAEAAPATKKEYVNKLFKDCKEYVISTCEKQLDQETTEHICQVYETIEAIMIYPHEDILIKPSEATMTKSPIAEAPEGISEKLGFHSLRLPSIEKHMFWKRNQEDNVKNQRDEQNPSFLSRIVDGKSALFGKKPPKPPSEQDILYKSEHDWTIL